MTRFAIRLCLREQSSVHDPSGPPSMRPARAAVRRGPPRATVRGSRRRGTCPMNALDWLLDSDPAIRWQAMRDLTDAPADRVAAERARVATNGWGARLLALRRED